PKARWSIDAGHSDCHRGRQMIRGITAASALSGNAADQRVLFCTNHVRPPRTDPTNPGPRNQQRKQTPSKPHPLLRPHKTATIPPNHPSHKGILTFSQQRDRIFGSVNTEISIFKEYPMYAVVKTGGKQYRVAAGEKLKVEQIPADIGQEITLDQVLSVGEGDQLKVGTPIVAGAVVKATVLAHGRHDKVKIFKMRRRKHYQKHQGHRQNY